MDKDSNGNDVILELKHIRKVFPGVIALSDVNFALVRGTVHAIVGENGAGKSTLMKILSGAYTADGGEIWIEGEKAVIQNERDGFAYGISMIYQELNSVLDMTVYENIYLGRMPQKGIFVDKRKMIRESQHILDDLEIQIRPQETMRNLSVAQRQMVEIAKAISREAKIIVMDEPTSSISQKDTEILFEFIHKLKARGISIIYISHRLEELPEIADEITVLRDGAYIYHCGINEITKDEIIRYMVGRELTNQFPKVAVPLGEVVLDIQHLTSAGRFRDISFAVHKGEILGFSGLVGAGRTEIMRAIFGLDHIDSGTIAINGKVLTIRSPVDAIRAGIAMVTEDRRRYGLVLSGSVKENISLVHLEAFLNSLGFIKHKKEEQAAREQVARLNIKCNSISSEVRSMSGGNQQKVVLAKWLLKDVNVLILDEPTRGIDVGAKQEIYKIMGELAAQGIAIIMISSELPEILGMSDRIIVIGEGIIKGELRREEASQERIMNLSAGGAKK